MTENPFITYNNEKTDDNEVIPKFNRTKRIAISLSEEAYTKVTQLAMKYTNNANISVLLEHIGLYALDLEKPTNVIDEKSGISTDDCRQAGFEDGLQGNPEFFIALFGKDLSDKHQRAYIRGYYEGNYIRNKK